MELNPTAFSQLQSIVYINLSKNNLKNLPEKVFAPVSGIEELDLSYNLLSELSSDLFNGTALSILHLKYNAFTEDLHFGLESLQQLDLSYNSITHVHHSMFDRMPGLTNLNLKGNGIKKIQPESMLLLKKLRHIDLSFNELDQVSSMLFFMNSELAVIRLNDNPRLSELPTDGFLNTNGFFIVYFLDLSNCAIGALGHKTFATMPQLTTLKLAWNNINNLPREVFVNLTKLIDLDLSNNLIVKLDDMIFMENTEMNKLNLAGNPITRLSVTLFVPLIKLRSLDVNDCELTSLMTDRELGTDYKFFQSLRSFNASGNRIKHISTDDVKGFKNLRSLDITNNPLRCDNAFQQFIGYVSVETHTIPKKMPELANLEDDASIIEVMSQAGWTQLAEEVCKHNSSSSEEEAELEKRLEESDQKLIEDDKVLSMLTKSVLDKNKLNNMQKILKGSPDADTDKNKDESAEEDINNGGEIKEEETDSADEDDSEDYSDDYDSDSDEDELEKIKEEKKNKNKSIRKYIESELDRIKNEGINAEEVELAKETTDKFLLGECLK